MTRAAAEGELGYLEVASPSAGVATSRVLRFRERQTETVRDAIAVEEPLEIRISGDPLLVTMRTPGHDHELCAGLLLAEGLLKNRADLSSIVHCGKLGDEAYGNTLDVTLAPGVTIDERVFEARRGTTLNAACGVCGRRTIDDLMRDLPPLDASARFAAASLVTLTSGLRKLQPNFDRTGGLHAAGIAAKSGEYCVVREDVGRHNATDKAIGRLLLDDALPATNFALVVSGRTSFEIVAKAWRAGISAIVGVSAPSSLAIATAERAGILLVGFARANAFNVYAGAARLETAAL
ncbi:MAG TPA: formate dehydrogenase accessory sulfurtransferase FdhD [Polyangiaceae bacterium]|jgi:FdhD protein|nr:formate dehydrogenase accessory sulfurtransferase FdhD [Polyangiaceae bacterium]